VTCDGVNHAECTGGVDLGSMLVCDAPSGSLAAVDPDGGEIGFVEGGTEHFDELSGLGTRGLHGCV